MSVIVELATNTLSNLIRELEGLEESKAYHEGSLLNVNTKIEQVKVDIAEVEQFLNERK